MHEHAKKIGVRGVGVVDVSPTGLAKWQPDEGDIPTKAVVLPVPEFSEILQFAYVPAPSNYPSASKMSRKPMCACECY